MRHISICIFLLLTVTLSSFEKDSSAVMSAGSIKLEGTFFSSGKANVSELSIEVVNLHTNVLEKIVLVKSKVKLDLKLGYKYMVYVKKKGYSTKKILVDAREANRGNFKFEFDMELHQLDEKISTTDFRPVCVLKYNRLKQKFEYDSDYTSIAKSDLKEEIYSKR